MFLRQLPPPPSAPGTIQQTLSLWLLAGDDSSKSGSRASSAESVGDDSTKSGSRASSAESVARRQFVEGSCGRLTVIGGLEVEESVKVTLNGWTSEGRDLIITLVTDESAAVVKQREAAVHEASDPKEARAGLSGEEPEMFDDVLPSAEKAAFPLVAVRIPGTQSGHQPAALLFRNDLDNPTETPIDTPAGPSTPLMVFFTQFSRTETRVTVLTWLVDDSSSSGSSGHWHESSVDVGTGPLGRDFRVTISDCSPKFLKVYASASTTLMTFDGAGCDDLNPRMVTIPPSSAASQRNAKSA
ncbi:hypothetical protein Efla_004838 [Eimeria flavescens]